MLRQQEDNGIAGGSNPAHAFYFCVDRSTLSSLSEIVFLTYQAIELRRFALTRDHGEPTPSCEAADIQEKIPPFVRVGPRTANVFLSYRDAVTRAARTQDPGIVDLELSLGRYVGKGTHGTGKLREEIEAEDERADTPLAVRWLGRPSEAQVR